MKNRNIIIGTTAVFTVLLFSAIYIVMPPIFATNDDVVLESTMSGVYYAPSPIVFYMNIVLSSFFSALYSFVGKISWMGIFFVAFIVCAFFTTLMRASTHFEYSVKASVCAGVLILVAFLMGCVNYVTMVTFTDVATIVIATGIFGLYLCADRKDIVVSFVFLLIGLMIRKESFYAAVPFIIIAFLVNEKIKEQKRLVIIMSAVLAGVYLLNYAFYSFSNVNQYFERNSTRIEMYDYAGIHQDESSIVHYMGEGQSVEDICTFILYDHELYRGDTSAAFDMYIKWGNYIKGQKSFGVKLGESLGLLIRYLSVDGMYKWTNLLLYMLYLLFGVVLLTKKDYKSLVILISIFCMRICLWGGLFWIGRYPERSLATVILCELFSILGFFFLYVKKNGVNPQSVFKSSVMKISIMIIGLLILLCSLIDSYQKYSKFVAISTEDECVYEYMMENADRIFFLDVFSVADRTQFVDLTLDSQKQNYISLGGTLSYHPVTEKKIADLGYSSIRDAICNYDSALLVVKDGIGLPQEMIEYELGKKLYIYDYINNNNNVYIVYSVEQY